MPVYRHSRRGYIERWDRHRYRPGYTRRSVLHRCQEPLITPQPPQTARYCFNIAVYSIQVDITLNGTELRRSQVFVWGALFSSQSWRPFLVIASKWRLLIRAPNLPDTRKNVLKLTLAPPGRCTYKCFIRLTPNVFLRRGNAGVPTAPHDYAYCTENHNMQEWWKGVVVE